MALKKSSNGNGRMSSNGNGHLRIVDDEETRAADKEAARRCTLYLLFMLVFFGWLLFDTWIGNHFLSHLIGYDRAQLNTTSFRLVAFTTIAGALGGTVNGIRSVLKNSNTFNGRYQWKYISAPWMGATLALFVYTLLRSSIAALGGNVAVESIGNAQVLSNFAAGALAGYGSKEVFIWLDDKVHKVFQVTQKVPNMTGKSEGAALSRLQAADLEVGVVSKVQQKNGENGKRLGTVVDQSPPPEASIDRGQSVDIAIAGSRKVS